MAITTAMTTSFKSELFSAGHCFNATVTPTGSASSGVTLVTSVSSMAGVAVGMSVSDGVVNIPAGTVVASIVSASSFNLSKATTGVVTSETLTISGDAFNMALIKSGMSGTYGAANVNFTDIVGNSDETSGAGYTTGGTTLTNVSPTTGGTTGFISFSPNPSWTSASFSTAGCMIYNASTTPRNGGTSGTNGTGAGRACSVHDFGGTQTVSAGTFTVLIPSATSTQAILRIQ